MQTLFNIIIVIAGAIVITLMIFEFLRYKKAQNNALELEYPLYKLLLRNAGLIIVLLLLRLTFSLYQIIRQKTSIAAFNSVLMVMVILFILLVIIVLIDVHHTGKSFLQKREDITKAAAKMLNASIQKQQRDKERENKE